MNRVEIIGVMLVSVSVLCLVVGVPCWIVASTTPEYYQCDELVAVPLLPMTADGRSYWTGAVPRENETEYQNDSTLEIMLPMASYPERYLGRVAKVHLLHNVFGFHLDITLSDNGAGKVRRVIKNRNMVVGGEDLLEKRVHPADLQKGLRSHGGFRVKCPYTTEMTRRAGIEPKCNRTHGYFMELPDRYEDIALFAFTPDEYAYKSLKIVFDKLTVLPMNFIEPPQMLVGVWQVSNGEKILISGSVITTSGLLLLVLTVSVFFACYPQR